MTKQVRRVYHPTQVEGSADAERRMMMRSSVAPQTQRGYDSKLKVLRAFLLLQRGVEEADLTTMTEDEFVLFLADWKRQRMGPAEAFRSALVQLQRAVGVHAFCEKKSVIKLTKGASNRRRHDKGVLTGQQILRIVDDLEWGRLGSYACSKCTHPKTFWEEALRVEAIQCALIVHSQCTVRPHIFAELRKSSVFWRDGCFLIDPDEKVEGKHPVKLLSEEAGRRVGRLQQLAPRDFLFPACVMLHVNVALQRATQQHGWCDGLVVSPMMLRHTAHEEVARKIEAEVTALCVAALGGSSAQTQKAHYRKPHHLRIPAWAVDK